MVFIFMEKRRKARTIWKLTLFTWKKTIFESKNGRATAADVDEFL